MESWLDQIASIDSPAVRGRELRRRAIPKDAPQQVHGAVVAALYSDPSRAARLAEIGGKVAQIRKDALSRAFAAKCEAHVAYVAGDHERAAAGYEAALALFDRLRADVEAARTLSSGLQSLILLGRYEQAHQWASRAEAIFLKHGDVLRLARLDSNVGNIYFRQDEPREAIVRYERALEGFRPLGNATDIAAALSNLAVCHTSLAQFEQALSYYRQAREISISGGLPKLAAQADYNIAYLHYLRGEYSMARELYTACRVHADAYHSALCDLDEAELVLELNLSAEGRTLASRAEQAFAKLGMRYEQAKAFVNLAVAASQRGYLSLADAKLRRARTLFAREGNRVWCAMTDLLRAVLAYHDQRYRATERLSSTAWKTLANTPMPGRAAHCQLLLARLWLQGGHADRALAVGRAALERVGDASSPALRFHARLLEGEVHEAKARWTQAIDAYERARAEIETLRTRVDTEDLRISILKDKLAVYDALVSLILAIPSADGWRRVLLLVQHAKSRAFADRLRESHSEIEAELNWCHRQIETAAPQRAPSALLSRVREIERELASRTGEPSASLESIQNALPGNAVVLEYFEARNVLHAFVMDRKGVHAISLGHSLPVRQAVKLVHFQLGKQRSSISAGLDAIHHHLGELYDLLIAPIEPAISKAEHLLIAPHRYLHGVPFAALNRAGRALIDRHTIAMIPSAHVFARLRGRSPQPSYGAAVFAAGSEHMLSEGALVSRILGGRLVQGAEATFDGFRETAASARLVHVAAHGVFRKDNPLFSSIRFADREVTLSDLKAIGLRADLVTLSACSTGRSVSVGGDELLGLMRAFLSSGASNVLASLWEIDDAVTNEFMKSFYKNFLAENSPAEALREAMLEVRRRYAHPYYWAPFIFTGRSV